MQLEEVGQDLNLGLTRSKAWVLPSPTCQLLLLLFIPVIEVNQS